MHWLFVSVLTMCCVGEPVPTQQFLEAGARPARDLRDFYGNTSSTVTTFYDGEAMSYDVKGRDGNWCSTFRYPDDPESVVVLRKDGGFQLHKDDSGNWGPRWVKRGGAVPQTFPGDAVLLPFSEQGLPYIRLIQAHAAEATVTRNGSVYRVELPQQFPNDTADRFFEFDSARKWVCVRSGLTWRNKGSVHVTEMKYRDNERFPVLEEIVSTGEFPSHTSTDRITVEDFSTQPADAGVFLLTTYGLPESLLAPTVKPWGIADLFTPYIFIPLALLAFLAAAAIRRRNHG